MNDVTQILSRTESGDPNASEQLLPLAYSELRQLAAQRLAHEMPGQTLQATALVHEAYIRLVDGAQASNWNSRSHFFGAAAEAMRRILVERARQMLGPKRGGGRVRVNLNLASDLADQQAGEILAVHEALDALAAESLVQGELVNRRNEPSRCREGLGHLARNCRPLLGIRQVIPIRRLARLRWLVKVFVGVGARATTAASAHEGLAILGARRRKRISPTC
jgi:RNA polymerase sigma factor (TIGR02999 family)